MHWKEHQITSSSKERVQCNSISDVTSSVMKPEHYASDQGSTSIGWLPNTSHSLDATKDECIITPRERRPSRVGHLAATGLRWHQQVPVPHWSATVGNHPGEIQYCHSSHDHVQFPGSPMRRPPRRSETHLWISIQDEARVPTNKDGRTGLLQSTRQTLRLGKISVWRRPRADPSRCTQTFGKTSGPHILRGCQSVS